MSDSIIKSALDEALEAESKRFSEQLKWDAAAELARRHAREIAREAVRRAVREDNPIMRFLKRTACPGFPLIINDREAYSQTYAHAFNVAFGDTMLRFGQPVERPKDYMP